MSIAAAGVLTSVVLVVTAAPAGSTGDNAVGTDIAPVVTQLTNPEYLSTDSSGNIYMVEDLSNQDQWNAAVWTPTGNTPFGNFTPDTVTTFASFNAYPGVGAMEGVDFHDGVLWISDEYGGLQAYSPTATTLYGVSVPADTPTTIVANPSSQTTATQITFDGSQNLYIAYEGSDPTGQGQISVLASSTGTLFGHSVTADQVTTLVPSLDRPQGIALDSSGDLLWSDSWDDDVSVLPSATRTVFGESVTANTPTQLFGSGAVAGLAPSFIPGQLALDGSGDLYVTNYAYGLVVLSNTSTTIFGTSVSADVPTGLARVNPDGVAVDSAGAVYVSDEEDGAIVQLQAASAEVTGVVVSGSLANPTLTFTGTGFGSEPTTTAPGCEASGVDFPYSQLDLIDVNEGWEAGIPGDCVGFVVQSWTADQVVVTLGSYYSSVSPLSGGDVLWLGLGGSYINEQVPEVTSVVPDTGPSTGGTSVTINGSGFTGATGVDFGSTPAASFTVDNDGSITATSPAGSVGSVDVTVIAPGGTSPTSSADTFTYTSAEAINYSCSFPDLGDQLVPTVVTESPAPPAQVAVGGTFQETLAVQAQLSSTTVDGLVAEGFSQLTVDSQTTAEQGMNASQEPSGAVSPNVETATATNLPQTYPLSDGSSVEVPTSYDPVTWETGPGTGSVYLVPGAIDVSLTEAGSAPTQTEQVTCSPPSNVPSLDSLVVTPSPPTPTFQVPGSTPPLQSQVTPGSDDGWSFTIANTSQATVTDLATEVTVTDGGTPPTFDTTAMTAAGTKGCTVSSTPGVLDCTEGNLPAGASDTVNVLLDTAGLSSGVAIDGSAQVESENAGSATDDLQQLATATVPNGVITTLAPGIAASSSSNLAQAGATVTVKLPKHKIPPPAAPAIVPAAKSGTVKPPVIGVTLETLPASQDPALCPQGCPSNNVVVATGDFSAYVDQAHPITATIQFFFGASVPTGAHIYMLKPNGKVVQLPACMKTSGDWNTPCVKGKQKVTGSAGSLSTSDLVYFTGDDPGFSLR